jgi:lysophospholipase L1-like esterase
MMTAFASYVALGDSFTEGVGDPDLLCRNGVRGWADRVAAELARSVPEFRYANLAVRGRLLDQVIDEQVSRAVELAPSLVTIYAGGNDLMRRKPDIDGLVARYATALAALTRTGARVVVFTAYDAGWAPVFKTFRGRTAIYNELLREVADDLGLTVVDYWRLDGYDDPRMWAVDRLHMSSSGHQRMAVEVLNALDVEHGLVAPTLEPSPPRAPAQRRRENLLWAKEYMAPWVERRLRGTSSGDGISPKSTALEVISPPSSTRVG